MNELPKYDTSDNPTNCCPRFISKDWDEQELHFEDKLFVKATSKSIFHIPLNINSVFTNTFEAIEDADALSMDDYIVMSHDPSAWTSEHLFAVTKKVPNQKMTYLTGDFLTKVFEGPYKELPEMKKDMEDFVESKGKTAQKTYFFYTLVLSVQNFMVKTI